MILWGDDVNVKRDDWHMQRTVKNFVMQAEISDSKLESGSMRMVRRIELAITIT